MHSRPLLAVIVAAVTLTIATSPLAAQQASVAPEPLARVVASYDLRNGPRELDFPRSVTVADSAGTILARVNVAGSARSIPMTVTVIESDLVLQGLTSAGVHGRGDAPRDGQLDTWPHSGPAASEERALTCR